MGFMRDKFEQWVTRDGDDPSAANRDGDAYKAPFVQQAWLAWKAAVLAERVECSILCTDIAEATEADGAWLWEARKCAEAIRAR